VPNCPKCGASVAEDAVVCTYCGTVLRPHGSLVPSSPQLTPSSSPQSTPPTWSQPYPQPRDTTTRYAILGFITAVLSLFILPEVFGSAAIFLGAYAWKKREGNLGLMILILGVIFMIVGMYIDVTFSLGDLLIPPPQALCYQTPFSPLVK
jgi:hypothetical protein